MKNKSTLIVLSLCIVLVFLFFLVAKKFDDIRSRYREIEPNLDNYAAAEIIILSFERMRSALLSSSDSSFEEYFFRMEVFESKINILDNRSKDISSFYYDESFINIKKELRVKELELKKLSGKMMHGAASKDQIFSFMNEIDSDLLDLQEVIYEIQIKHFDEIKNIINENYSKAIYLAMFSIGLVFLIVFFVIKNIFYLKGVIKKKNLFISSLHHELATSAQAIVMAADIMEYELINEKLKHEATLISMNASKIMDQTKEIMDYARLEMKKPTLNKDVFYINDLIYSGLEDIFKLNGNDFKFYESSGKKLILSDQYKIFRIVVNLLDNANKYTSCGRIFIHAKVINNGLFILVRDNGIGFNMKNINYFFQAFNQGAENKTKQGLGLGLTIIKSYIESLKGRLVVKSIEGVGSSFLIYLPIELVEK